MITFLIAVILLLALIGGISDSQSQQPKKKNSGLREEDKQIAQLTQQQRQNMR